MKVLMVLAHPDDEIIFGWPILENRNCEKEILICSSDERNPNRSWCAKRKYSLFNLCKSLNIPCTCLAYDSAFYKVDARKGELKELAKHIEKTIRATTYDYIYTHNPIGEYGMMDHILLHNIVMTTIGTNIIISDMFLKSNWSYVNSMPEIYKQLYYTPENLWYPSCVLDTSFYEQCKKFYTQARVWTWSKPPITNCKLYLLKGASK